MMLYYELASLKIRKALKESTGAQVQSYMRISSIINSIPLPSISNTSIRGLSSLAVCWCSEIRGALTVSRVSRAVRLQSAWTKIKIAVSFRGFWEISNQYNDRTDTRRLSESGRSLRYVWFVTYAEEKVGRTESVGRYSTTREKYS